MKTSLVTTKEMFTKFKRFVETGIYEVGNPAPGPGDKYDPNNIMKGRSSSISKEGFQHAFQSFNSAMKNLTTLQVHLNGDDHAQAMIREAMDILQELSTYIDDQLEHEEGYESEQLNPNMAPNPPVDYR